MHYHNLLFRIFTFNRAYCYLKFLIRHVEWIAGYVHHNLNIYLFTYSMHILRNNAIIQQMQRDTHFVLYSTPFRNLNGIKSFYFMKIIRRLPIDSLKITKIIKPHHANNIQVIKNEYVGLYFRSKKMVCYTSSCWRCSNTSASRMIPEILVTGCWDWMSWYILEMTVI